MNERIKQLLVFNEVFLNMDNDLRELTERVLNYGEMEEAVHLSQYWNLAFVLWSRVTGKSTHLCILDDGCDVSCAAGKIQCAIERNLDICLEGLGFETNSDDLYSWDSDLQKMGLGDEDRGEEFAARILDGDVFGESYCLDGLCNFVLSLDNLAYVESIHIEYYKSKYIGELLCFAEEHPETQCEESFQELIRHLERAFVSPSMYEGGSDLTVENGMFCGYIGYVDSGEMQQDISELDLSLCFVTEMALVMEYAHCYEKSVGALVGSASGRKIAVT